MNEHDTCAGTSGCASLQEMRRQYIGHVLEATGHDLETTAHLLAIPVRELERLMRRLGLE